MTGTIDPSEVSVVIPVRDNLVGLRRALESLRRLSRGPREIVVVDSASSEPVELRRHDAPPGVTILREHRPGAARARNAGWRAASGAWVLLMDSDCIATRGLIEGFSSAANGAVAYAGAVRAVRRDRLPQYYESQQILVPPPNDDSRPAYLVTANALVARAALTAIGGFDDRFPGAAGEDIDLAYRLLEIGDLSYAPCAVTKHAFEPGLGPFVRRFVRYGRGNRLLTKKHAVSHMPRPFVPAVASPFNYAAAMVQFSAMFAGYALG